MLYKSSEYIFYVNAHGGFPKEKERCLNISVGAYTFCSKNLIFPSFFSVKQLYGIFLKRNKLYILKNSIQFLCF